MNKKGRIHPDDVVMYKDMVKINPESSYEDVAMLKELISKVGQLRPITLIEDNDGQYVCIDGRHRTQVCRELCFDVAYEVVDIDCNDTEALVKYVLALDASRSATITQKAIKAWKLHREYSKTMEEGARLCGVAKNQVTYVNTIHRYGDADTMLNRDGKDVVIAYLFAGGTIKMMNDAGKIKSTSSLETLARYFKRVAEGKIKIDETFALSWNPDSAIHTEMGKKWYAEQIKRYDAVSSTPQIEHLIELANYKFTKAT